MSENAKHDKFVQALARDHSRQLLGYVEREEGYYPIYKPPQGSIATIATMAFILCKRCNGAISPSGGPKPDAVCLLCFEKGPE